MINNIAKKLSLFLLASTLISAGVLSTPAMAKSSEQALDRIIVIVNDSPVTQSELDDALSTAKKQLLASGMPTPSNITLNKQILNQLVDRKLQLQVAEQSGIKVTDEDINKVINDIASQNNFTVAELYQKLASQGMSKSDYRKEIHDELIIQRIQQQQVGAKITMTPEEIRSFAHSKQAQVQPSLKQFHLMDITVTLPETPTAQDRSTAKTSAELIASKLRQGGSFATEAKNAGSNASTDFGWQMITEMPSIFVDPVSKSKQHDIIGPLLAPNGYHIIYVAEIRNADNTRNAPSDKNKEIEQMLYQQKFEAELKTWIAKLRSEASINWHPDN